MTNTVPDVLKVAVLSPLLKNSDADYKQHLDFRPISFLKFISKLIEKTIAVQLTDHVMIQHLGEMFQSAYKTWHSTETALVKFQNDILRAIDNNESVILLLLNLSAAFDTFNHSTLLSRLSSRLGIRGNALASFKSYFTSRKEYVQVDNCKSTQRCLARGVPQGSVLGPLLYILYTSPIADIIKLHILQYHLYADVIHLRMSFKTDSFSELTTVKVRIDHCVTDIDRWMVNNGLKLNQGKA